MTLTTENNCRGGINFTSMAHASTVNKFDSFQKLRRNSEHGFRVELVVALMVVRENLIN